MRLLAILVVGVLMVLISTEGKSADFVMHGPNGEVADQDTEYYWFPDDDGVPHKGYMSPPNVSHAVTPDELPTSVRFHLWTKLTTNPEGERIMLDDIETLHASTFNSNHRTKIIIHGLGNTIRSEAIQKPKDAYMTRGAYNVIGVDWGDLSPFPWYFTAMANTIPVGNYVGKLIKLLVEHGNTTYDGIHLIGHSLGAHVSGIAGGSLGEHKISRVTGLDPAGPRYIDALPEERLNDRAAEFVDAIHTCGGDGFPKLGLMAPVAMADFYPNGGVNPQPGCESIFLDAFSYTCSHSKAHKLWTASILQPNPELLSCFGCVSLEEVSSKACSANGAGVMGEDADPSTRGILYIATD